MRDENKSEAQIISELQQLVAELEQDKAELQELLLENNESEMEYFDSYFHAHDMMVSVDVKTENVVRCNRAVMDRLCGSRAEIVGHPIFELYHQDCVEDAKKQFRVITEGALVDASVSLSETLSSQQELPALKEIQELVIAEALKRADGNQTVAARLLGISRQALNKRLRRARRTTGVS